MAQFIDTTHDHRDVFEIVDEFPFGYIVWPIGRENFQHPGYIPVARPGRLPYHINRKDLKAVKCADEGEALYILKYASLGGYGADEMNKTVFDRIVKEYREMETVADLTADEIANLKPIEAPGLFFWYHGEKHTPANLYFSSDLRKWHSNPEEYEGRLYTHFDNALRYVYNPDGSQFERRGMACVCARYKDGVITDFHHE